ncbi:MAG: FtsQ-type POTRA domain-containing protein [Calditrichaeota bacterium]|nr:MAG: FtsQ-type POTRA domain-containing protein [Calditrichota bacterium]
MWKMPPPETSTNSLCWFRKKYINSSRSGWNWKSNWLVSRNPTANVWRNPIMSKRNKSSNTSPSLFYPTPRLAVWWVVIIVLGYITFKFGTYLIQKTNFFAVHRVEIVGNKYLKDSEILSLAAIDTQQTLYDIDPKEISERILNNPYIKGVSITRAFPTTLLLSIEEREPVLYLVDRVIYMVDESGLILKKLPDMPMGDIPIITGISKKSLEKDMSPLMSVLGLKRKIEEVDNSLFSFISEIHLNNDGSPELYLVKGGGKVYLGKSHHYERLYYLSQLLNRPDVVNRLDKIKRIDLRFQRRIILQKRS